MQAIDGVIASAKKPADPIGKLPVILDEKNAQFRPPSARSDAGPDAVHLETPERFDASICNAGDCRSDS